MKNRPKVLRPFQGLNRETVTPSTQTHIGRILIGQWMALDVNINHINEFNSICHPTSETFAIVNGHRIQQDIYRNGVSISKVPLVCPRCFAKIV